MATTSIRRSEMGVQTAIYITALATGPYREIRPAEQLMGLRQGSGWQAGRNSITLIKQPDLRIVLTALKPNAYVHEHYAARTISVQIVEGHIRMRIPGRTFDLKQGDMIVLEPTVPHDLEALTESAYLLTIAWHDVVPRLKRAAAGEARTRLMSSEAR